MLNGEPRRLVAREATQEKDFEELASEGRGGEPLSWQEPPSSLDSPAVQLRVTGCAYSGPWRRACIPRPPFRTSTTRALFCAASTMAFSTGLIKLLLGLGNLVFFVCLAPVSVPVRGWARCF